jgi:hypothetical protein
MTGALRWVKAHAPAPSTDRLIVAAILCSVLIVGLSASALVLGWQQRQAGREQARTDEIAACRAAYSAELITGPIAFGLVALAEYGVESDEFRTATKRVNPERFVELAELSRTDTEAFLRLCHESDRVGFSTCAEAKALGVAPMHRGEPGYAPHLDADGDGIACE